MTIEVKICGLTRIEDAGAIVAAGADYAGLVFHPRSPRYLPAERGRAIAERLRGRVRIVALLVDPNDVVLAEACAAASPDFIQLHGLETPARVAEIRARTGRPVIKAVGMSDKSDFGTVAEYEAVADLLLFDAKAQTSAPAGGQGRAFDWQLLGKLTMRKPWLLAGGLTKDNVARAIRISGARAVDVSSGVENAPGLKDAEAISSFIAAARAAECASEAQA